MGPPSSTAAGGKGHGERAVMSGGGVRSAEIE